jgi:UDP-N-acetylglucosamine 3-dehydrogenase
VKIRHNNGLNQDPKYFDRSRHFNEQAGRNFMSKLRAGIIGTGRPHRSQGATGSGMSHAHARAYINSPDAELVAVADIVEENARAFQEEHNVVGIYTDYNEMLQQENLDIVSVCTWPHLHAPMVVDCANAKVRAVHCEKPMATTFGDAKRMVEACNASGTQLTFNHQRRFGTPFRHAKELLKEGRIGELQRIEARTGNLYDWGTHWFDMMFFYNDETPVEWLIGQVEARDNRTVFGAPIERQGLAYWKWQNDVYGLMTTGFEAGPAAENTLIGTEGRIEVGAPGNINLRIWGKGQSDWEIVPTEDGLHGELHIFKAIQDAIDALNQGREPELAGRRALQATELIFATYESSRRRGRVTLPLDIEDSPLVELIESVKTETAEGGAA